MGTIASRRQINYRCKTLNVGFKRWSNELGRVNAELELASYPPMHRRQVM